MSINKMTKEELELLSNKEITALILEESKSSVNTAALFKKIITLLELPSSTFEKKIGDYYTALSTDKRFVLLEDGTWDLRTRHTSDKVVKIITEDEEDDEEEHSKDEIEEEMDDHYDHHDDHHDHDNHPFDDANEDLKDLVVIDEDELELE